MRGKSENKAASGKPSLALNKADENERIFKLSDKSRAIILKFKKPF